MSEARFQTGNGITLCTNCHKLVHKGYNGKPDLQQPMDAQGGEKIEFLAELFIILATASNQNNDAIEDYYFLSDQVLLKFKYLQDFPPQHKFEGTRIEQAANIWRPSPPSIVAAIIRANLP